MTTMGQRASQRETAVAARSQRPTDSGTRPRVLLICSSDLHVALFVPVARELTALGMHVTFVSLDRYYHQRATARAVAQDTPIVELPAPAGVPPKDFYRRPAAAVLWDVIRARANVKDLIREQWPRVVVVGNDRGLVEKLILAAGRSHGAATVLVQDGHIATDPTPERGWRRRLWRRVRRAISAPLLHLGARSFAATSYGTWGCDRVCASGPEGATALAARGVPTGRIAITGQPRYEGRSTLPGRARRPRPGGVVWFTTPFAAQNLGETAQQAQESFVAETAAVLAAAGIPFTIKPHPREDPNGYGRVAKADVQRPETAPAGALTNAELAIIGISTVLEEAAIAAVPVAVPGGRIHGGSFERLLPDRAAYPHVETGIEIRDLAVGLRRGTIDRTAMIARQRADVSKRILLDAAVPASRRVADVILEVSR